MGFFTKLFRRSAHKSTDPETEHAAETHESDPVVSSAVQVATDQSATTDQGLGEDTSPAQAISVPVEAAASQQPAVVQKSSYATATLDQTNWLNTKALEHSAKLAVGISSQRPFAAWAARDIGRVRRSNQDNIYAMSMSLPHGADDIAVGLWIVADGMGGHAGGDIASRQAVETVMIAVLEQLVLPAMADEEPGNGLSALIVSAIQEANQRIWQMGQEQGTDMGTTCTAALLVHTDLYIAHVGDSRAYMYTGATLQQLTTDHSTVGRLIAMGQLEPLDARTHPLRSQLYRSLGQAEMVDIDIHHLSIAEASHLVLCSDGLWGMVDDDEIATILHESPFPQDSCRRLIAQANLAGGEDNIGVVVVSLPSG